MASPVQSSRSPSPSPSPSPPSGKSEVSDLKLQLRNLAGSRAPGTDGSKRELFKKVISYMTIGVDVSSLFSEMVMCSATSDVVLKKMCCLCVGNYAKGNPDLALLTINFLQKDCHDEDPMIRGLALWSLCTLRVANLVGPLGSGLKDSSGYESALAQVVANCLSSLQEIWTLEVITSEEAVREKEALLSKPVIYHLLNRIKAFSEWAQCLVLDLASKYHANGAVVLATIKVFLHLTLSTNDVHHQVYEHIKAPLLTSVSTGSPEQSYAVLSHLHLLVMRAPILFSSDYKHFYCQYNEPSYVKKLKLEMLTAVANESNTYEIVAELCEHAANVDVPIARESIRAVGKIALQQYDVNAIVDRLLQFLKMEKDYVTAETLVLVKDLLGKYPQWSHDCIAVVGNISSKNVQEPKAKTALMWMLGEYSQDMLDAPYILESLVDNWDDEHSAEVRLHLLTAVLKCFFRRPPETQKALGAALAAGLADSHEDVHDRALLLQYDVSLAERVVDPPNLSILYQKPSYMFTDKEHRGPFEFAEELGSLSVGEESADNVIQSRRFDASDNDLLLSTTEKEENKVPSNNGSAYSAPDYGVSSASLVAMPGHSESAVSNANLPARAPQSSSGIDDLLGLGLHATIPSPPPLKLNAKPVLDPGTFQRKWGQLPISLSQEDTLSPHGTAALTTPQVLLRHMQSHSIQYDTAAFFLVECLINASSAKAQIKIKADDGSASAAFSALFR
ncbi:hypothetical protein AAC387_Pa03g3497 [Persea americana]